MTTIRAMLWGPEAGSAHAAELELDCAQLASPLIDYAVRRAIPTAHEVRPENVRLNREERAFTDAPGMGYRIIVTVTVEQAPTTRDEMRLLEGRIEAAVSVALLELLPEVYVEYVTALPTGRQRGRTNWRPLTEDRGE